MLSVNNVLEIVLSIPNRLGNGQKVALSIVVGSSFGILLVRRYFRSHLPAIDKVVLITGCDTGFGRDLAFHLAKKDCKIVAGILRDSDEELTKEANIRVVKLDITSESDVENAQRVVEKVCGESGLWAVVNNAGVQVLGDVEICRMEEFRKAIEVNLLGHIRVTKALLPLVRKARGRVVNVSSVKDNFGEPLNAAYCVSKYGLAGFTDVLRVEMLRFGVDVVQVRPFNFGAATGMLMHGALDRVDGEMKAGFDAASPAVKEAYGRDYVASIVPGIRQGIATASCMNISLVTRAMTDAVLSRRPSSHYHIKGGVGYFGDLHWWCWRCKKWLPVWMSDRITYLLMLGNVTRVAQQCQM